MLKFLLPEKVQFNSEASCDKLASIFTSKVWSVVEFGHIKVADTHMAQQERCTMSCKNLSILELEKCFPPHSICQTPFDLSKSILGVQKKNFKGFGDYHRVVTLILHLHFHTYATQITVPFLQSLKL